MNIARRIAATACLIAGSVAAQNCAKLAVHGTGKSNTKLTFTLAQRAANAPAVLAFAARPGHTTLHIGRTTLRLGLAIPIVFASIGKTNAHGVAGVAFAVPKLALRSTLHVQGLVVTLHGPHKALHFCTSKAVGFHVGG